MSGPGYPLGIGPRAFHYAGENQRLPLDSVKNAVFTEMEPPLPRVPSSLAYAEPRKGAERVPKKVGKFFPKQPLERTRKSEKLPLRGF